MNLLETYNSIDLKRLRDYVDQQQEEHLHLEFKTVGGKSNDRSRAILDIPRVLCLFPPMQKLCEELERYATASWSKTFSILYT